MTPHLTQEVLPVRCGPLVLVYLGGPLKEPHGGIRGRGVQALLPIPHVGGEINHGVGGGVLQNLKQQKQYVITD